MIACSDVVYGVVFYHILIDIIIFNDHGFSSCIQVLYNITKLFFLWYDYDHFLSIVYFSLMS